MGLKFKFKIVYLFPFTLYTQPEGDFIQYFKCACALIEIWLMRSGVEISLCGVKSLLKNSRILEHLGFWIRDV